MLFGKNRTKAKRMPARECTLDPVLHVIETLKDYRAERSKFSRGIGQNR